MARHPRLIYPETAVHIVQRGNNRSACFRGDSDYLTYLGHLRYLSRKYGCALHAYCLMTNHVHLLLTPSAAEACGRFMHDLGSSYVRYFNKRHVRSGTLWEGRFRSCIAESARYVIACYRYIEMNPVRAGMVIDAGAYPWSSHQANVGRLSDPSLTPHPEFAAFTSADYRGFFCEPLEQELLRSIREATNGGYPLASEDFKVRLSAESGRRTERGRPGPRAIAMLTK